MRLKKNFSPARAAFVKCGLSLPVFVVLCSAAVALAEGKADKSAAAEQTPAATPAAGEFDINAKLDGKDGTDFVCQADVYYTVQHFGPSPTRENPKPKRPSPSESFFRKIGERGLIGPDVKARLEAKIPEARAEALDTCRQLHEDRAACVSSRLKYTAPSYRQMDYESRRALLKAIERGCDEQRAECLGSSVKPVNCFLSRPSTLSISEPKEPEKKDEKEKKKK